ncbi:hypothetical protein D3C86_2041660 [compost metagenome]
MGLIHVNTQLFQATQFLETLVRGQLSFLFRLVEVVEVGGIGINAGGRERFTA